MSYVVFEVILTERESSEAWLRSWVGMLDEYYTHHRSRFHRLLPWLSDTHNKLGEWVRELTQP